MVHRKRLRRDLYRYYACVGSDVKYFFVKLRQNIFFLNEREHAPSAKLA